MSRFTPTDHDYPGGEEAYGHIRTVNGVYVDLLDPRPEMIRLGDVVRPLKRNLANYRDIEMRMAVVIGRRFGLDGEWWTDERIHAADEELLVWEMATVRDCAFRQPSKPFAVAAAFQNAAFKWGIKR